MSRGVLHAGRRSRKRTVGAPAEASSGGPASRSPSPLPPLSLAEPSRWSRLARPAARSRLPSSIPEDDLWNPRRRVVRRPDPGLVVVAASTIARRDRAVSRDRHGTIVGAPAAVLAGGPSPRLSPPLPPQSPAEPSAAIAAVPRRTPLLLRGGGAVAPPRRGRGRGVVPPWRARGGEVLPLECAAAAERS